MLTQKGQSFIEILVAMGVFVMVSTAGFFLFFGGQSLIVDSANSQLALDYASEGIEAARSIRDRSWGNLADGDHGLVYNEEDEQWQFSGTEDNKEMFTRIVTISTVDANTKKIVSRITWQITPARTQSLQLTEELGNWVELSQSSCKVSSLAGDWTQPLSIGSGDLGPGNEGTDVLIKGNYAYIGGTAASAAKPDLFVFDISVPASPELVKSVNIGAGGINSLFIKGDYLYAASPNNAQELIIFDITTPSNPTSVGSYNLSGDTDAIAVVAFGDTAAIGRESGASYQLAFINVAVPSSPSIIDEVFVGGSVKDFAETGDKLFAMVSNGSGGDVWIYDIGDSADPVQLSIYDIPSMSDGRSVYLYYKGNSQYLLVGNGEQELVLIGATTTSNMYVRDRVNVGGAVNDIVCVASNWAFIGTDNSIKEFIIVNVNDPDNIFEQASLNYPQVASGIDFYNNNVFMAVRSNDSLRTITSTP
ncbi:MAG: hypothetical protein Q8P76_01410 [bacterium]|nr:hypothetical protein [bacterium]